MRYDTKPLLPSVLKNQSGYTFLELLSIFAIGSIITYTLSQFIANQYIHMSSFDKQDIMRQIMAENVVEINGIPLNILPNVDRCMVRRYQIRGDFIDQNEYNITDSACSSPPAAEEILVVWKITKPSLGIAFNPSTTLKLPTYNNTLKQVEVSSFTKNSMAFNNQSIIIFRK